MTHKPDTPARLRAGQAAALLGVTPRQVANYATAGLLSAIRTPGGQRRYLAAEVAALAAQRHEPQQPAKTAGEGSIPGHLAADEWVA